jgi:metal-responsive CopG/Arc/MetJ family transcriptional regulator
MISASPTIIFIYYFVLLGNMQTWTIKLDDAFAKEIEKTMKPLYTTKSDIIREALRRLVKDAEKDALIKQVMAFKGSVKTRTSDKELRRIREEAWKDYAKGRGLPS